MLSVVFICNQGTLPLVAAPCNKMLIILLIYHFFPISCHVFTLFLWLLLQTGFVKRSDLPQTCEHCFLQLVGLVIARIWQKSPENSKTNLNKSTLWSGSFSGDKSWASEAVKVDSECDNEACLAMRAAFSPLTSDQHQRVSHLTHAWAHSCKGKKGSGVNGEKKTD